VKLNSVSGLCVTKIDVLDGMEKVGICTGYTDTGNGQVLREMPFGARSLATCEPVIEEMPGWSEATSGVTRYEDLPVDARRFLSRIEELVEVPVEIISTGPERNETLVLNDPFEV
jgi:adenylosuccinate synthase